MKKYLKIGTLGQNFRALCSWPASLPAPVIVVLHGIFGINRYIRALCDRLADGGYIVVCPDLFWRMQPGVDLNDQRPEQWRQAFGLYTQFDRDKGVEDIGVTLDYARELPQANGKVAVLGVCMGGLMSYLVAARKNVEAAVIYYAAEIENHLDEAPYVSTPLLVHFAEDDEYVPLQAQLLVAEALSKLPNAVVYTYPGRCHGFANSTGSHYDARAAAIANERTMQFLHANLPL